MFGKKAAIYAVNHKNDYMNSIVKLNSLGI